MECSRSRESLESSANDRPEIAGAGVYKAGVSCADLALNHQLPPSVVTKIFAHYLPRTITIVNITQVTSKTDLNKEFCLTQSSIRPSSSLSMPADRRARTPGLKCPVPRPGTPILSPLAPDRRLSQLIVENREAVEGSSEGPSRHENSRASTPLSEVNGITTEDSNLEYGSAVQEHFKNLRLLSLTPQSTGGGGVRPRTPQSPAAASFAPFAYHASGSDNRYHPYSSTRHGLQATRHEAENEYSIYGPGGREVFSGSFQAGQSFPYITATPRPKDVAKAWKRYKNKCEALETRLASDDGKITFSDIPLPVLDPRQPITDDAVHDFILSPFHSANVSKKRRIHRALRIYHPDKALKILKKLDTDEDRKKYHEVISKVVIALVKLLPKEQTAKGESSSSRRQHQTAR